MSTVFLTGATGLVGSELLRRLLTWDPRTTVVVLVRPRRRHSAEERLSALLAELFPAGTPQPDRRRVRFVEGDLSAPRLGLSAADFDAAGRDLTHVYHLGADVRFDLPLDVARAVHVAATDAMLDLAAASAARGELERFHHVSTFAAGRRDLQPVVLELPPLLTRTFRNSYERTKAEAEALVLERSAEIPATIHRLGIVIGDSRTGWTSKFDTFYLMVRLLLDQLDQGLRLERLPVPGRALLNAIPVDIAADALYAIGHSRAGRSGEILHYTAGDRATRVLDALRLLIEEGAASDRRAGHEPRPIPELVALDDATPETVGQVLSADVSAGVLEMLSQLMPYGFDNAVYDNRNLLAALENTPIRVPPIAEVIGSLVAYPHRSNWGTVYEPRPPLAGPPI